jgi:vitamin B12 transporter
MIAHRTGAASLLTLAVLTSAAVAQQRDTFRLREIVVSASRLPSDATTVPASVTVIDGARLREKGVNSLADALREVAGMHVVRTGSWGGQTSLFLRGGESDYVRVLVDGVAVNQPGGAIDLAGLTADNIDRIEIVRGPASVLYGSDAVTGVVQIFTRRGTRSGWSAAARAGNHGTREASGDWSTSGTRSGLSAGASRLSSEGIHQFNSRYRNATASLQAHFAPDPASEYRLIARGGEGVVHYPTDGAGALSDSNQYQEGRHALVAAEAVRRLSSRFEARASLGIRASRDRTDDRPDGPGDTLGFFAYQATTQLRRGMAELRGDWHWSDAVIVTAGAGLESHRENTSSAWDSEFGGGSSAARNRRTNHSVFGQLLASSARASLQAGVRLDDNQQFGSFLTARLGGSFELRPGTRLRASAGTAFKEPTFVESHATGFATGNPALRPERSRSVEVGLRQELGGRRGTLDVAAYDQRFRDMIQYTFLPPGPGDPNFSNVAGARSAGIEAELRYALAAWLAIAATWSWNHTAAVDSGFDGTGFAEGRPLLRRPAHLAGLDLRLRPSGMASASLGVRSVGARTDLDFSAFPAARVELPPYLRTDASVSAHPASGVSLTLRVENLFNRRYQEVIGFAAPGRLILTGVSLSR